MTGPVFKTMVKTHTATNTTEGQVIYPKDAYSTDNTSETCIKKMQEFAHIFSQRTKIAAKG
jgi:hypothetical protein